MFVLVCQIVVSRKYCLQIRASPFSSGASWCFRHWPGWTRDYKFLQKHFSDRKAMHKTCKSIYAWKIRFTCETCLINYPYLSLYLNPRWITYVGYIYFGSLWNQWSSSRDKSLSEIISTITQVSHDRLTECFLKFTYRGGILNTIKKMLLCSIYAGRDLPTG